MAQSARHVHRHPLFQYDCRKTENCKIFHVIKMKAVVTPLIVTMSTKFQRLYLFWGSGNSLELLGILCYQTGSGKCKTAATKLQMHVSPLPDKRYQRNSNGFTPMFWGPAFQRDQCGYCTIKPEVNYPRWRPLNIKCMYLRSQTRYI